MELFDMTGTTTAGPAPVHLFTADVDRCHGRAGFSQEEKHPLGLYVRRYISFNLYLWDKTPLYYYYTRMGV